MTDKELLQTIKALRARIIGLERENRELKEQNKRYKEALERIASEKEVSEGDHDADIVANKLIYRAQEALEGDD